jgi:hypothetical protein
MSPKGRTPTQKPKRNVVDLTITPFEREFSLERTEFNSKDESVSPTISNSIEQIYDDEGIEPSRIPFSRKSSQAKLRKPSCSKRKPQPPKRQTRSATRKRKTTKNITDSQAETLELERIASEGS